jgi:hypothetical protein
MPGINTDGYGDWRDTTIEDALRWLRIRAVTLLLALGLIEDGSTDDDQDDDRRPS